MNRIDTMLTLGSTSVKASLFERSRVADGDAPASAIRTWVVNAQEDRELAAAAVEWHKKTS